MFDSQFLIAITIAFVATAVIVLCFTPRKSPPLEKVDSYEEDPPKPSEFVNDMCQHLQHVKNYAAHQDEIFLENETEKYYNKKCKHYDKESKSYPNYNAEVCKQVRTLIHGTASYDLGIEIDLHDDLEKYFNENCKVDRYKVNKND